METREEGRCPQEGKGRVRERVMLREGLRVINAPKEPSSLSLWMPGPSCLNHNSSTTLGKWLQCVKLHCSYWYDGDMNTFQIDLEGLFMK